LEFDWNDYGSCIERAYEQYQRDFGTPQLRPRFQGMDVREKFHPAFQDKSGTFWHLLTEGNDEQSRTPVRERIERISWPRALIENSADSSRVCSWLARKKHQDRWHLALTDFSYLVVLAAHQRYVVLWTAFFVERQYQREKLRKEFLSAPK